MPGFSPKGVANEIFDDESATTAAVPPMNCLRVTDPIFILQSIDCDLFVRRSSQIEAAETLGQLVCAAAWMSMFT
jgi:hypothetical protein